jgi:hypothetical protein
MLITMFLVVISHPKKFCSRKVDNDDIKIVGEAFHAIKVWNLASMFLKLDMEKAYDGLW